MEKKKNRIVFFHSLSAFIYWIFSCYVSMCICVWVFVYVCVCESKCVTVAEQKIKNQTVQYNIVPQQDFVLFRLFIVICPKWSVVQTVLHWSAQLLHITFIGTQQFYAHWANVWKDGMVFRNFIFTSIVCVCIIVQSCICVQFTAIKSKIF